MRVFEKNKKGSFIELDFMARKIYLCSSGKDRSTVETAPAEPLREELKSFVECVLKRAAPRVGALEGRNALELALMVSEKIRGGIR
jgi:predicted dehydrogenase